MLERQSMLDMQDGVSLVGLTERFSLLERQNNASLRRDQLEDIEQAGQRRGFKADRRGLQEVGGQLW